MIYTSLSKNAQDLQHCKTLWDSVFKDPAVYSEHYFTMHCKNNTILTLYDDREPDTLLSMLHMNPYKLCIHDIELPGCYIVGVATSEPHRHRGYMRRLLEEMFALCSRSHIPFVHLMPAQAAIYEPFDFRKVYMQQIYHGSRNAFSGMIPFLSMSQEYQQKAVDFANQWLSGQYDIYTRRNQSYYTISALEMRACNGDLLVDLASDAIQSIITYSCEKEIEIMDYCGVLPADARPVPSCDCPSIMARVTDFCALAKYMRSTSAMDTTVQIVDPYIPANNGCFRLKADSHQGSAHPIQTKTPELVIPVSEVFDIFFRDCNWHINEIV